MLSPFNYRKIMFFISPRGYNNLKNTHLFLNS